MAAATATVAGYLDRIEDALPASSVRERTEEFRQEACPLADRGDRVRVRRELAIDPSLDRVSWAAALGDAFSETDGWVVREYSQAG